MGKKLTFKAFPFVIVENLKMSIMLFFTFLNIYVFDIRRRCCCCCPLCSAPTEDDVCACLRRERVSSVERIESGYEQRLEPIVCALRVRV